MENGWTNAKWTWKEWVHENALLKKWVRAPIIFGGSSTHLFEGSSTHFLEGHEHSLFKGAQALIVWRTAKQRTSEPMQNGHESNEFMKCSLEKWGRAPIILGGLEHPSFWGLEHPFSRRARAPIIQRAIKWRTSEQLQNEHERNKFMKMLSWKNEGAHPLFLRARALIILGARALIF